MAQAAIHLERLHAEPRGLGSWLTTVDHKRIGILYFVSSFLFFLVGGLMALTMRTQLIVPDNTLVGPHLFNQLFTTHGLIMIFLFIMPMNSAFFNFLTPLMIGARDVAFPRLNSFSFWMFLFGALLLLSGGLFGDLPNGGWFGYTPLTSSVNPAYLPGDGTDFFMMGAQVLGISSIASALNFFITIVNMRAPGMSLMRMPIFVWMTFITSILLLLAMPAFAIGLIEMTFDRKFDANFFNVAHGGDPVLWQHVFWVFGHPEVYILVLPPFGMISELLPTFSRKPLFGYPFMVYSAVSIGFLAFGVWAHHMFIVGLGPVANTVFAGVTMLIAIPTGVKIFNWLGTVWGGSIKICTPLLYAAAFVGIFTIGGITGVMHASVPIDYQQSDTYFIVAHFHYVVAGIAFAIFGAIYYWFPKFFGKMMDDKLGQIQFWLTLIGFNLTFFPMHFVGVDGMSRRYYTYHEGFGYDFWNMIETMGAYVLGLAVLMLIVNMVRAWTSGQKAPSDPWDGRTLEWSIPSPPPVYNFAEIPAVHHRDAFWEQKHGTGTGTGAAVARHQQQQAAAGHGHGIHLPPPSIYPILMAAGLTLMAAGFITTFTPYVTVVGIGVLLFSIYGMAFEPIT
jgi:cytochrome c oxidase subunit 1